jgi:hypothetical protein
MRKLIFGIFAFFIFLSGTVYADDYKWDLINALANNNFQTIENILKTNINMMSAADKRLVMNFALTYSSGENTLRACELLLKYDVRPAAFDLYTAIYRDRQNSAIQFLIRNGAVPNGEILLLTMEKRRLDLAKQFIEMGADVNYQYPLSKSYADGMTPLLYAAKWGNFETVKLLTEKGANVNVRDISGNTALSTARANDHETIYNYLLEHGAVELANNYSQPIQSAGISSLMDNKEAINFQKGKYRLFTGNTEITFLGNGNSGNINYTRNGVLNTGFYRIEGNNLSIIIEGRTFAYTIDSNVSFSGNNEIWVSAGNSIITF